ncbi:MAG: tRNA pseudouridine(55) synthase TruB [Pseudomonadota bacterium]
MPRRKSGRPVNGWLTLDKPLGMTSTHAVNVVKRLFQARKAGHAGTLDPLATGVLPIAFGEATKTMNFAVDGDKAYRFHVRWGAETATDDSDGEVVETSELMPTLPEIEAAMVGFVGEISQVPPKFSAIKVDGQRAYDLARDGAPVALAARTVVVHDLKIIDMPDERTTAFEARCGKGTYVRAIARDLGRTLGCLGHIVQLRRTRVGPFTEDDAITLERLEAEHAAQVPCDGETIHADPGAAAHPDGQTRADTPSACDRFLAPVAAALHGLDEVVVASNDAGRIRRGQAVVLRGRDAPISHGQAYATTKGQLVALGEVDGGTFIPTRVFNL